MKDEEVGEAWANNDKRVCVHAEIVEQLIRKLVEERNDFYFAMYPDMERARTLAKTLANFNIDPATWPEARPVGRSG